MNRVAFTMGCALSIALVASCSSSSNDQGSGGKSAGSTATGGKSGSSATGGSPGGAGQSASTGGNAAASGGASAATGGKSASTGGNAATGTGGTATSSGGSAASGTGGSAASGTGGSSSESGSLTLTSKAFADGTKIDTKYRCTGPSPDLQWSGAPADTKSFAIVLMDLTPGFSMNFLHWVIYDIDPSTMSLDENVPIGYAPTTPAGAHQAPIWNGTLGFNGPCAPSGTNMYSLTLYALDVAMLPGVSMSTAGADVVSAIQMHAIGMAKLSITSSAM